MMIIKQKNSTRPYRQTGIAVVECAIVFPLVLFLVFAVAELAHGIRQYNTLTQTVRDAARYIAEEAEAGTGVVRLTTDKITATSNLVAYGTASAGTAVLPGLAPGNVTVTHDSATNNISVKVEYAYQPLFGPSLPVLAGISGAGGTFTMKTEVIMRVL
jgi:Flp pilus assembly protein TadG